MVPLGIPHSTFLGWSEEDQDKALAWSLEERVKCPGCGTRDEEWRDETGKLVWPPPYEVNDKRCAGCEAMAEFQAREDVKARPEGLYLTLRPYKPTPEDYEDMTDEGDDDGR